MVQILKEAVRDRIALAAEVQFARAGFRKTTMEGVAREAGVSIGNIYKYFPNKKALFQAVVSDAFVAEFSRLTRKRIEGFARTQGVEPGCPPTEGEAGELLRFWIRNRRKAIILLARSEGTEHERFGRDYVRDMAAQAVEQLRESRPQLEVTPLLRFMLEKALGDSVRGIVAILEHFEEEASILEALSAGSAYHVAGLNALADWACAAENRGM